MSQIRASGAIRQQQIVEAARKIVATRGMEELTISEIAKEVGISGGDIYRHFKSKKEILLLLMDDIESTLLEAVDKAAQEEREPLARLENVLRAHLSHLEQRRGISFIVIAETLRQSDRDLRKRMLQVIEAYLTRLKEFLEKGVAEGRFREVDLDSAALLFFGMVQATATMWALGNRSFVPTHRHSPLWEVYRELIAARDSGAGRGRQG